ncbi:MAG: antibiotic biosynthesis monooxygenase [Rhodocyclaceae bacterium]|nr:antibiotic biosynthesis monooxygenase [Rhodocyclaceae bacterium]
MHIVIVHVKVKPECVEDFIAATRRNHEGSLTEPGCRRFDVLQSHEDATRFILYEAYASAEDAARHKETTHYAHWRDTVAPMMAEPRQSELWQGLLPA